MNKKAVIIIVVVLLILCLICSVCLGITYLGAQKIYEQGAAIKTELLDDICVAPSTMTESDYETVFSTSFKSRYDYDEAVALLNQAFPSTFECSDLLSGSVLDMISSGQAVSISTVNGVTTGQISFNNGSAMVIIYLSQSGTNWEISDITVSSL